METKNGTEGIKLTDPNYLRTLVTLLVLVPQYYWRM